MRSRRGWRQRWAGTSPSLRCSRWGLREGRGTTVYVGEGEGRVGQTLQPAKGAPVGVGRVDAELED